MTTISVDVDHSFRDMGFMFHNNKWFKTNHIQLSAFVCKAESPDGIARFQISAPFSPLSSLHSPIFSPSFPFALPFTHTTLHIPCFIFRSEEVPYVGAKYQLVLFIYLFACLFCVTFLFCIVSVKVYIFMST